MRRLLSFITAASIISASSAGLTVSAFDFDRGIRFYDSETAAVSASADPSPSAKASPAASASTAPSTGPTATPGATAKATPAATAAPSPSATAEPSATATNTPSLDVTKIILNKTTLELKVGETFELVPEFEPEGAVSGNIAWNSSDPCITVENGKVTAVTSGTAVVEAMDEKSRTAANCYVTVTDKTGILNLEISEGVKQVTVSKDGLTSEVKAGSNELELGEYTVSAVSEEGFTLEPYSETVTVTDKEQQSLSISAVKSICYVILPEVSGCTITPVNGSTEEVAPGGSYSFTISTSSSFNAENMSVKANGTVLEPENGVYTVSNITNDITISIDGVESKSWDATLKRVAVLGAEAVLGENDTYSVSVPFGSAVTTEDIEVETNSDKANYTVTTENGKFIITVKAEDGTEKQYSLDITEAEKTELDDVVIQLESMKFNDIWQRADGSYSSQNDVRATIESGIKADVEIPEGITVTVENGDERTPVSGTLSSPDGEDGMYKYKLIVSDGEAEREIELTIAVNAYDYVVPAENITATATTITVKNLSSTSSVALYNEYGSAMRKWETPVNGVVTFSNLSSGVRYVVKLRETGSSVIPSSGTTVTTIASSQRRNPKYYTVTFDAGLHGTIVSGKTKQSVKLAYAPEYPEVKADDGYVFKGWSRNGVLVEDPKKVQIRSTTEFTAIYEQSTGSSYGTSINRPSSDTTVQEPITQPVTSYMDVQATHWFYDSVMNVTKKGYMNGTGDSIFEPNSTLTRAMLVTILHRYAGEPAAEGTGFSDVPAGTWYTEAVTWAADAGIVNGTAPGVFEPNTNITREQLATIMYRYAEAYGYDISAAGSIIGFSDSYLISDWAQTALIWTTGAGIIGGKDNNMLDPRGNATRAEAAAIIERFDNYIG